MVVFSVTSKILSATRLMSALPLLLALVAVRSDDAATDPVCLVCGPGFQVGAPDNLLLFPGEFAVRCGLIEDAGREGYISPDQCPFLPNLIGEVCQCQATLARMTPVPFAVASALPSTSPFPSSAPSGSSFPSAAPSGSSFPSTSPSDEKKMTASSLSLPTVTTMPTASSSDLPSASALPSFDPTLIPDNMSSHELSDAPSELPSYPFDNAPTDAPQQ